MKSLQSYPRVRQAWQVASWLPERSRCGGEVGRDVRAEGGENSRPHRGCTGVPLTLVFIVYCSQLLTENIY